MSNLNLFKGSLIYILLPFFSIAQNYSSAVDYLEFIDRNNASIVENTWNYMYTYTQDSDYRKQRISLKKLENTILNAIREVNNKETFDEGLKNSALTYLNGNLAIVTGDYKELLKNTTSDLPVIQQDMIKSKVRIAIRTLRSDYDMAISNYAQKYQLIIENNTSELAVQMQHTIAVYDYHYELRSRINRLKSAERDLWNDFQNQSLETFNTKATNLHSISNQLVIEIDQLSIPTTTNTTIKEDVIKFTSYFSDDYMNKLHKVRPILSLNQLSTAQRSKAIRDFNEVKDWFNVNRTTAYDHINKALSTFLRNEIKPITP